MLYPLTLLNHPLTPSSGGFDVSLTTDKIRHIVCIIQKLPRLKGKKLNLFQNWTIVDSKGALEPEMIDRFRRFKLPTTVDEAVDVLISDLTTQQMSAMGRMTDAEFDLLCRQLVPHLQHDFRLWTGNDKLLYDCFETVDNDTSTDPMRIILERMRERLTSHQGVFIAY